MKKFLSLVLALMMLLCSVYALAEMAGGWTTPEETLLTDDASDTFYGAVGYEADLWPQCLMAIQVVAGTNYAILCAGLNDVEIVYVYHNVSGENELLRRQVLVSYDAELAGGWNDLGEGQPGEEGFTAIDSAFESMVGIDVKEYYILGQQVVAGINYAVLCHKATVTAEPVEGWAMATVYVDLDGNASVTDIQDVVLSISEE